MSAKHDPIASIQTEPYPEAHTRKGLLKVQTITPKQRQPLEIPITDRPEFVEVTAIVKREVADALDSLQTYQLGTLSKFDSPVRAKHWRGEIFEVYAIEHIPAAFCMTFGDYVRRRYEGATVRTLRRFAGRFIAALRTTRTAHA